MKKEIELKYYLDHINDKLKEIILANLDDKRYTPKLICQNYIAVSDNREVRVRMTKTMNGGRGIPNYMMTVKTCGGMSRDEVEFDLGLMKYTSLIRMSLGSVKKIRHLIPMDGYNIELDVYLEDLKGLITAEIEFPDEHSAKNFNEPKCLECKDAFLWDMTELDEYKNKNLALNGIPEEIKLKAKSAKEGVDEWVRELETKLRER